MGEHLIAGAAPPRQGTDSFYMGRLWLIVGCDHYLKKLQSRRSIYF